MGWTMSQGLKYRSTQYVISVTTMAITALFVAEVTQPYLNADGPV